LRYCDCPFHQVLRGVPKNCASRAEKAAHGRAPPRGDATRSASLSGSVDLALVARCCACPPHRRLLRGRIRHWPPPARPQYPRRRPATSLDACPPPFAPLVRPITPVALCYHRQRRRESPPHLASSESGEIRGWDSSPQRPRALLNYRRNPAQHHHGAAPAVSLPAATTAGLPSCNLPTCTAGLPPPSARRAQ